VIPKDKAGIMNLQRLLNERGANLKVDGIAGPATRAAHQKFGTGSAPAPGATGSPAPGAPGETLGAALGGGTPNPTVPAPGGAPAVNNIPDLDPNASDTEVEKYIRKNFGFAAWALDTPEIRQALVDFTKSMRGNEDWTDADLQDALMVTQWWKDKDTTQRARIQERNEDPQTYNKGIAGEVENLRDLAVQNGVTIPEDRLRTMAGQAYDMGWSPAQRKSAVAAEFDYNPDTGANAASSTVAQLRAMADNYLIPLSEATIDEWGRKLIAGTADQATIAGYMREQSKLLLPTFAKQIESGLTPKSLVTPYREAIARELSADPNTIDMLDPKYNRFINNVDPKTGSPQLMNFFDIQKTIRTDDTYGWDRTEGAVSEANQFATEMAKRFGRAG
jgi:hypothetical protein